MRMWKWTVVCCVLLRLALPLWAADIDVEKGLLDRATVIEAARGITLQAYPNADDVLVDNYVLATYQADGTGEQWDDQYVKVLTEKGKRDQQSISRYFDLPYETSSVKRVELIKPDGRVIPIDVAKQSRVMVDPSQINMNIYAPNQKILRVSIPGLEIGDVCRVLSYHRTMKSRVPDTWSDYTVLEYTSPIKHLIYEVVGPKDRPLANIALRDEIPGTVKATRQETADGIRYRWEVSNVPRMFEEPNMPATYTVVQRLLVSTIPDWQSISRWYTKLSAPHLEAVTPEMKDKVAELVQGATNRNARIEKIFQFVSQQIRYMGITTETEAPGYEPHDVKVTFQNRYGVCRDKAALLASMLRLAEIPAYPVLIYVGPKKDEKVPQPYFNHAIVGAQGEDGAIVLMDPTDEHTTELLPSYLCNRSYLVANPEGDPLRTSPIIPAAQNLLTIRSTGKLDAAGTLSMQSTLQFAGINDNAYRGHFSQLKPVERRRFFEGRIKDRVPGARLTAFDIQPENMQDTSKPLTVTLSYEATDYPVKGDAYSMLPLPWLGTAVGYVNFVLGQTGLDKRKYPLSTEIACGVREEFQIALEGGLGPVVSQPAYSPISTNTLTFEPRLALESNVLQGSSSFLLNTVEFTPAEYLVLKQALKDIEYSRRMKEVFRAVPSEAGEYDVGILSDDTSVELVDARNWTTVQSMKMKVLTYAGKKRFSELKFAFNPAWADVKLDQAIVTNPDGKVHTVAKEEMNLMDAAWVGAAPRYPGEKTLVVSLPGVEVGSVIEYRVIQTMKDVPFFSLNKPFRGFEPADSVTLRVSAPSSLNLSVLDGARPAVTSRRQEQQGRTVWEWQASRLPTIVKEDSLPPSWDFTPTVFVSAGDWAAYARQVGEALKRAAAGQARAADKARELTRGLKSDADRITAIRDFVARAIRPAGPSMPALPLSCITPADRTLAEGYGNTSDRAVVLVAMLEEAGLNPEFVLASSWGSRLPALRRPLVDCPQRGLYDGVLVRVKMDGQPIVLNDSDQYAALGATPYDGHPALALDGRTSAIAALPGMQDRVETDYRIDLSENGDALVTVATRYLGPEFAAFHKLFAELPPEERSRHFKEMIAGLSQAAEAASDLITQYDGYPGTEVFSVRIRRFAVRSGDYLYLGLLRDPGMFLRFAADQRVNPLHLGSPVERAATYTIRLPESTRDICLLPRDAAMEGPAGMGKVTFATKHSPGSRTVEIAQSVNFNEAVVPAEGYPQLLEINRRMRHPESATLLIRVGRDQVAK